MFADMFKCPHGVAHMFAKSTQGHRDRSVEQTKRHGEDTSRMNVWAKTFLPWARELARVSHGRAMSSWQPHEGVWRDGEWQRQTHASSSGGDGPYGRGDAVLLAKRPRPGMDVDIRPGPGMHDGGGKGVGPGHDTYGMPPIWYHWTGEHEHARHIGFQQGLQKGHQKGVGIGFGKGQSMVEQEPEGGQVATRKKRKTSSGSSVWDPPTKGKADLSKFPRFECLAGQKIGWVPFDERYQDLLRNAWEVVMDGGESPTIKMTIEGWDYELKVWARPPPQVKELCSDANVVGTQRNNETGRERPIRIIKPTEVD